MRFRRRRSQDTEVELNITAFLNLMVVLIPFLLINAVFAQVSVLQLNLPAITDSSSPTEDDTPEEKLTLEVLIYSDRYEVVNRARSEVLEVVENTADGHDRQALHDFLVALKSQHSEVLSVTLLLEEETPYETMIETMDTVRLYDAMVNGQRIRRELFPQISIGSAPRDQRSGGES